MQLHFIIFSISILPCLLEARLTSRENLKDYETTLAKNKPFHLFSHRRGANSPVTRHNGIFSPKQLKISRSNPSHKVPFIHGDRPSWKSKHHLQDHPPQFARKSPFLSNAWSPLSKTNLAIRKRTARAEEHASEHDEKLDTASQTRKEKVSDEDDNPNISTAMVDMKELLQKLMEKAESEGELNTVDVTAPSSDVISAPSDVTNLYNAPLQESHLSSNARGNEPADDLRTVRNQVTSDVPPVTSDPMTSHPLDTTAAAVPPVSNHHMGFNRGPLPNVQLGMKASALPPSSAAAKSTAHAPDPTPELDRTPFRPMKLPASVASPPAEVPSIEPNSEGKASEGWSVSLAGFGGGSQDSTDSDNSLNSNKLVNSAGTPASDNSLHSTNTDQHVEVLDGIEAADDDVTDDVTSGTEDLATGSDDGRGRFDDVFRSELIAAGPEDFASGKGSDWNGSQKEEGSQADKLKTIGDRGREMIKTLLKQALSSESISDPSSFPSNLPASPPSPSSSPPPSPSPSAGSASLRIATPSQSTPRGPGTFYHFVNSPMKPEDGSNCTFDPMEEGEPVGPQMSPRMQLQAMAQTVAQTMLQNAGVPRVNPKPQPVTELERQPLLKTKPQPLPESGSRLDAFVKPEAVTTALPIEALSSVGSSPPSPLEALSTAGSFPPSPLEALSTVGSFPPPPPGALLSQMAQADSVMPSSGVCPPCRCECAETGRFKPRV